MRLRALRTDNTPSFSALQRAEIAEMSDRRLRVYNKTGFSALQRAEIAEMQPSPVSACPRLSVSVLFNEPKLLKCYNENL